jgi:uncharacterized protein (DUF305 family)
LKKSQVRPALRIRFPSGKESHSISGYWRADPMKMLIHGLAAGLLILVANTACSRATMSTKGIYYPTPAMRALGIYQPYSDADIEFMTGMIPHHAQAIIMAGWAPERGARSDVAILCERIVVAQADEIRSMQEWLRDRGLPVPDAKSTRMKMMMNGVEHEHLMPGMLTDEEMAALEKAKGAEFDRLFLQGMIKHHQGAIDMVNVLFDSYGAAQDDVIYKFASDVFADQSIEIEVMNRMLETVGNQNNR